ncbi:MAG: WYL domain-containing protein [bacterium]
MITKEIQLVSLLYDKPEIRLSEIAKTLKVSTNQAKKMIDSVSKELGLALKYNKKNRTFCLVQQEIERSYMKVEFWSQVLMYIFSVLSRSEDKRVKNLACMLLSNFAKFYMNQNSTENQSSHLSNQPLDLDFLFLLNETLLSYVKQMDYFTFVKIKNAIVNKNEIRITVIDRLTSGYKRVNLFPLYLSFLRNSWYLVGFSDNEYVVFDVDDIKEIFLTGKVWEGEINFSVEEAIPEIKQYIVRSKKYNVKIDITDYLKVHKLSFFHPSQRIEFHDGKVFLRIEIVNLFMLFNWLSSFGTLMKIVEPDEVKQKYIEYLMSIVNSYNEGGK